MKMLKQHNKDNARRAPTTTQLCVRLSREYPSWRVKHTLWDMYNNLVLARVGDDGWGFIDRYFDLEYLLHHTQLYLVKWGPQTYSGLSLLLSYYPVRLFNNRGRLNLPGLLSRWAKERKISIDYERYPSGSYPKAYYLTTDQFLGFASTVDLSGNSDSLLANVAYEAGVVQ